MGRLKILAKSHILSKTAPILFTFTVWLSALLFLGNFSIIVSYGTDFVGLSENSAKNLLTALSSFVGIFLFIMLLAPLNLGKERWFMLNARGGDVKIREMFYYFNSKRIFHSVAVCCLSALMKISAAAVFFFPFLCLSGVMFYCIAYHTTAFALIACLFVADTLLFAVGCGFMFIYSGTFLMYYPIAVSNEHISPTRALSYSRAMTSPVLLKIAAFKLSFAPWWLLCLAIIPSFYCWGYYKQSLSELAFRNEYLK